MSWTVDLSVMTSWLVEMAWNFWLTIVNWLLPLILAWLSIYCLYYFFKSVYAWCKTIFMSDDYEIEKTINNVERIEDWNWYWHLRDKYDDLIDDLNSIHFEDESDFKYYRKNWRIYRDWYADDLGVDINDDGYNYLKWVYKQRKRLYDDEH